MIGYAGALASGHLTTSRHHLSLAAVVVVAVLGELAGSVAGYALGRFGGRPVVDRIGRFVLVTHRDLDRAEEWLDRRGESFVFFGRLIPLLRSFVSLAGGLGDMAFAKFLTFSALGSAIYCAALAGVGYSLGASWHKVIKDVSDVGYVVAALFVLVVTVALAHRLRVVRVERDKGFSAIRGEPGAAPADARRLVGRLHSEVRRRDHGEPGQASERVETAQEPSKDERRWVGGTRPGAADASLRAVGGRSTLTGWEKAVARARRAETAASSPSPVTSPASSSAAGDERVEGNGRLTGMTAAVLLVLLAVEGSTILRVGRFLTLHVVLGMVLVPIVAVKIASTIWRFARYYLGDPAYRRKGPPPVALRLLGPFLVVLTVIVLGSGIALLLAPARFRHDLLLLHQVSFVLWFAAMVVHVLGHLLDTTRLAPRDFYRRTRRQVRGASKRQWLLVSAIACGILLGLLVAPKIGPWRGAGARPRTPPPTASTTTTTTPSTT